MKVRHVQCPVCGAILNAPAGLSDCFVRCGTCKHRFRLPRQVAVTDDAVAEWLAQPAPRKGEAVPRDSAPPAAAPKAGDPDEAVSGNTAVLPALTDKIRVLRIESRGATFEFPSDRLTETEFRCAMPRGCMRCGGRNHLDAHLVVYAPLMEDAWRYEGEKMADLMQSRSGSAWGSGEDLLTSLPRVPGVPPPADLPMPYWLCDLCTGSGLIAGQINVNASTGRGQCRLRIKNLLLAEEFFVAAGGEGSDDHARLVDYIERQTFDPWNFLPEIVQQRVSQWYSPQRMERFKAYVPDMDLPRVDEGMCGLVVTSQRLIYQRGDRHDVAEVGDRIRLQAPSSGAGKLRLNIKTPHWEVSRMSVDRYALEDLRKALAGTDFKAIWY